MLADKEPSREELPAGWTATRLGDICTEIQRRTGSVELPVLSVTKHQGMVRSSDYFGRRVHSADISNYKVVAKRQLAYATIHLNEGSIGLLRDLDAGLVSPMYTVFSVKEGSVLPEYLYAVLKQPSSLGLFQTLVQGTVNRRGAIPFARFAQLFLIHPPLEEQHKIASILSSVDETIEKTQIVVEQLNIVKRGFLRELLTQGMPGQHSKYKMTPVGSMPDDWECVTLASVLERIDTGWSPLCEPQPAHLGEWGVLKVSSVSWGEFKPEENKRLPLGVSPRPETEVCEGDLLVSRANTRELVGRSVLVKSTPPKLMASDKLLRLRPIAQRATSAFINYALSSDCSREQIEEAATGSSGSMKNISQERIRSILIPRPSVNEQKDIAAVLDSISDRIQGEVAVLHELRDIKSVLMELLLSGAVRVRFPSQEVA